MKKRLLSLIALIVSVLSVCLVFVACGEDEPSQSGGDKYKYTISKTEETLTVGDEITLTVTATPSKELKPTWSVSPASGVVTVDQTGKVTAVGKGKATVKAKVDGKELSCAITVEEAQTLYTYMLNTTDEELEVGDTLELELTCTPERQFEVKFESSDSDIASVTDEGVVTAKAPGDVTIDAIVDEEVVDSCAITVIQYVYNVTDTLEVDFGDTTAKIEASVTPNRPTNFTFEVAAEGASIISVDPNGKITTLGLGTAEVTVKDNGKEVGKCEVTVNSVVDMQKTMNLHVGDSKELELRLLPGGAQHTKAFEVTEGDTVVSVSPEGVVTALDNGTATITATIDGKKLTCEVTVANVYLKDYTVTELEMDKDNPISLSDGAEYWEQYIAQSEINHKQYDTVAEDIINSTRPIIQTGKHYLGDYKAWLSWDGGATSKTCSCGNCNKDTQNGGDGGWTNNGTKAYLTGDNITPEGTALEFVVKVFPGESTIKIYAGTFCATCEATVYVGDKVLGVKSFSSEVASVADCVAVTVDVKEATEVKIVLKAAKIVNNGFLSLAGATVSGNVYRLKEYSARLVDNGTKQIEITENGEDYEGTATFVSDTPAVATVNESGLITAVSDGTAKITVTVNGRVREFTVNVGYNYSLNAETVSLLSGQSHNIVVTSEPAGFTGTVTYTSNDTGIATVDSTGKVTAVAEGETTVDVEVDSKTMSVKVVVAKAAVTSRQENATGRFFDLTAPHYIYWEYYLYNETEHPAAITPDSEGDLIRGTGVSGAAGENNGSGMYVYFEGGAPKASSTAKDSATDMTVFNKYSKGTAFSFDIVVPAGKHDIEVYTGAWQTTAGKVALLDGDKELASQSFDKKSGGVSLVVTFSVETAEQTTLKLKLDPTAIDDGATANLRMQAIAIADTTLKSEATTSVTVDKRELNGPDNDSFNMSEVGTLDWMLYNIEIPDAGSKNVMQKNDSDYIQSLMYTNCAKREGNQAWDYKAKFTWTDGDSTKNASECSDGDTDKHGLGAGWHDNGLADDSMFATKVKVNADVKTITLFVNGWDSSYEFFVYDSHGNRLYLGTVAEKSAGQNRAFAVTVNITATTEEYLTVGINKTAGSNVAIAGVAVSGGAAATE